jgi:hypothetical protein
MVIVQQTLNISLACVGLPSSIPMGEACVLFTSPCDSQAELKELLNTFQQIKNGSDQNNPLVLAGIDLTTNAYLINANGQPESNNAIFMVENDPSLSNSQGNLGLTVPAIVGIVVVVVVILAVVVIGIIFFRRSSGDTPMEIV